MRCFKKGETPEQHKAKRCYALAGVRYNIPDPGTKTKFCHMDNKFYLPFTMYLVFEGAPMIVHQCLKEVQKSVRFVDHEVVRFSLNVVSRVLGVTFELRALQWLQLCGCIV